jgi:hypothetical protein
MYPKRKFWDVTVSQLAGKICMGELLGAKLAQFCLPQFTEMEGLSRTSQYLQS